MRRFHFAALAAVAAIGFTSVASAADLPVKAPIYKAPAAVAVYNWSGCYVGGNVGLGWAHKDWFDPQVPADEGSNTSTGILGGGQIGCDYQTGQFVFGVQGMFDWADLDGSHQYTSIPSVIDHSKVSSLATLTGRIGYAVQPAALIYLKGGAAWVRDTFTETAPFVGYPGEAKVTRSGWIIGGGVEYRFMPNWSAFVEYNYMDFGSRTSTLVYANATTYDYSIKQDVQTVLVGVNYRFSAGW
jgi:outer membrane immunogenic protein